MDPIFHQIRPHSIPKGIAQQIKDLIRQGKLHPGEKLPSERTLAEMLGVGRSSLREAINTLETLGIVKKINREGIFVRSIGSPILSDPLIQMLEEDESKFFELYEIRKDIEIASAYMSGRHRTQDDLEKMRKVLDRMRENAENKIIKRTDDLEFHMAIAVGTHNLLRVHILKNIFDLFGDFITHVAHKLNQNKKNILMNIEQHNRIYDAIRKRDSEKAREAMNEHLSWVEEKWREFGPKRA